MQVHQTFYMIPCKCIIVVFLQKQSKPLQRSLNWFTTIKTNVRVKRHLVYSKDSAKYHFTKENNKIYSKAYALF